MTTFVRSPKCTGTNCGTPGLIVCDDCLHHNAALQGIACIDCWDRGTVDYMRCFCTCAKGRSAKRRAQQTTLTASGKCDCPGCQPALPTKGEQQHNPFRQFPEDKRLGSARWNGAA